MENEEAPAYNFGGWCTEKLGGRWRLVYVRVAHRWNVGTVGKKCGCLANVEQIHLQDKSNVEYRKAVRLFAYEIEGALGQSHGVCAHITPHNVNNQRTDCLDLSNSHRDIKELKLGCSSVGRGGQCSVCTWGVRYPEKRSEEWTWKGAVDCRAR
ncbi:unnamed protein product [Prunus armeniaca]|uniref:Uncharacterized protein n=1 Tax=Prunus armeniaca TaxID=36596 RepID=A0A6J5UDZ0_PRUAR|nr:unnamed protein product [Prunus armeniaca]